MTLIVRINLDELMKYTAFKLENEGADGEEIRRLHRNLRSLARVRHNPDDLKAFLDDFFSVYFFEDSV